MTEQQIFDSVFFSCYDIVQTTGAIPLSIWLSNLAEIIKCTKISLKLHKRFSESLALPRPGRMDFALRTRNVSFSVKSATHSPWYLCEINPYSRVIVPWTYPAIPPCLTHTFTVKYYSCSAQRRVFSSFSPLLVCLIHCQLSEEKTERENN